jgi:hypothetical protein
MKLFSIAIILGAAVAAVPGVVSAEVSSCVLMRSWSEDASRESLCTGRVWLSRGGCITMADVESLYVTYSRTAVVLCTECRRRS